MKRRYGKKVVNHLRKTGVKSDTPSMRKITDANMVAELLMAEETSTVL
ncbi:MAG: hypothetical protein WC560_02480 [Syntrophales bacterium]